MCGQHFTASTERHKHSTSATVTSSSNNHGNKYSGNTSTRDSRPYDRTNTNAASGGGGSDYNKHHKTLGVDRQKPTFHGSGSIKSSTVVKDWSREQSSGTANVQTVRASSDGRSSGKNSRDRDQRDYIPQDSRVSDSHRDSRKEYSRGPGDLPSSISRHNRQGSTTPGTGASNSSKGQSIGGNNVHSSSNNNAVATSRGLYSTSSLSLTSQNSVDHRPSSHRQSVDSRIAAALGQVDGEEIYFFYNLVLLQNITPMCKMM